MVQENLAVQHGKLALYYNWLAHTTVRRSKRLRRVYADAPRQTSNVFALRSY